MEYSISIGGPRRQEIHDEVEYVKAAERVGVSYAWAAEAWGRDAVSPLAYLAACTERIKLGTGTGGKEGEKGRICYPYPAIELR